MTKLVKPEVTVIRRIKFVGKWAEFWFKGTEGKDEPDRFDRCCKAYMLANIPGYDSINEEIDNRGYIGLQLVWEHSSPNWEPFCWVAGRSI